MELSSSQLAVENTAGVLSAPLPVQDRVTERLGHFRNSWPQSSVRTAAAEGKLLTAFQPVYALGSGQVIGAAAQARFLSSDGATPEQRFAEVETLGLRAADLELAALDVALRAAQQLRPRLSVTFKLSPAACLFARLPALLYGSVLAPERTVIQLTEGLEDVDFLWFVAALEPLRRRGVRIAVRVADSGSISSARLRKLRPDVVKLDRSITTVLDEDPETEKLACDIAEFARGIGATTIAEGIETATQLKAVMALGVMAGQGYLLGRPSVRPEEWAMWHSDATNPDPTRQGRPASRVNPGLRNADRLVTEGSRLPVPERPAR